MSHTACFVFGALLGGTLGVLVMAIVAAGRCEPIVRCRDCASVCEDGTLDCHGPLVQTWDYWNDEPLRNPVPPDGFCAWGKRRAE